MGKTCNESHWGTTPSMKGFVIQKSNFLTDPQTKLLCTAFFFSKFNNQWKQGAEENGYKSIPCIAAICLACIRRFCCCCCNSCCFCCWVTWFAASWWVGESSGFIWAFPVPPGNWESSPLPLNISWLGDSCSGPPPRWGEVVGPLGLWPVFPGPCGRPIPPNCPAWAWTQNPVYIWYTMSKLGHSTAQQS